MQPFELPEFYMPYPARLNPNLPPLAPGSSPPPVPAVPPTGPANGVISSAQPPGAAGAGPRLEALTPEQLYHLPKAQLDALVQQADLNTLSQEQRAILFMRYPR